MFNKGVNAVIISLRKWVNRAKYVFVFLVLAFLLYHVFQLISDWLVPNHRFGRPDGEAVKASAVQAAADGGAGFRERLRFFYWYGE